jgi:glycosyltransferase involved in cell wall biosynthesis
MGQPSSTHLVLIPSYNTGMRVLTVLREALRVWTPVWVVVDGSTDGSADALLVAAHDETAVRVIILPRNQGKGAAIHHAVERASEAGFSHVLTMDADGQHDAASIPRFMAASAERPRAMILGQPGFGADAPALRLQGRKLSNWCARLETMDGRIGDCLFGFRVYPIAPLLAVFEETRWMRGFDFDPEAAVRLSWRGIEAFQLQAPIRYFQAQEGGVSHFHYGRDNALLTWMHLRLIAGGLWRLPKLLGMRRKDRA